MKGLVIKSTGSWYRVRMTNGEEVNARLRGKFKLDNKKITNPIAVGDEVVMESQQDEWVINEIEERKNYIIRKSPKKKHFDHLIAANVDQALMIATLKEPRTSLGFIDRFLVTLEAYRIPGVIVFNKVDLLDAEGLEEADYLSFIYEKKVGYPCIKTSFIGGKVPEELSTLLRGKRTLLSGHSGSGKSTLINLLLPEISQKTSEISSFSEKGTHTTTFAEMFFLDGETAIIDTPGIKELGLSEIEGGELGHYFPEIREVMNDCRFHNCQHVNEPGCAVKKALEEGGITQERYYSYLSMLESDDNRR
ncbi:ribosome small subunit-dependent GTPase A [Marinoscillum sp. 108]|uniref:ribosome small subunit-dependent GTPase A n=1 Tax=Marinoscillum sp. 108 TaxID=2653151 RepID=UPI0012F2C128|nr:ribosome small subunit-dependent GTPase A [Marinoscillum sp. 108]VXD16573.1 Small ribosomal subunit biogenesis GTPase RsgA [Marinoscillum sp. 108]